MTYTVFISYTSKDKQLVTALTEKLNGLKQLLPNSYSLKIWDMDVDCSGKWDDACKNALRCSNAVVCLITEHVYPQSYVHQEIDLAKECCDKGELKFIPVFLTETPIRNDLGIYTTVFCGSGGLTEEKLNEIYVKTESNLKETLRLPYTSDTVEKIRSHTGGKFFVGREDKFKEIKDYFDSGEKTVILTGLGGIGKTELARNFVLKYGAEYPNSFIIKTSVSDTDTTAPRSAKDLVRSIRFENTPSDTDDAELIFRKNLECLKSLDKKTILIIDGFDVNLDLVQDIWQIFSNLNCEVIFTSRQKSQIAPVINVNELTDNETLQIFAQYCPNVSQSDALEIAKGVDYHTLTVELAARLLGQSQLVTPSRLKESVFDVKSRIPHDRNSKTATIFEHIENIFNLSNLSMFKTAVLCGLCRICSKGLTFDELKPYVGVTEENEYQLNELIDAGLVRFDGKYSLHPVISEVAFRKMPVTAQSEVMIADFLAWKVDVYVNKTYGDTYALLEYADHYLKKRLPQKRSAEFNKTLAKLYFNAAGVAQFLGMFDLAVEYCGKSLNIIDTAEESELTAKNYCTLSECYAALSQYETALEYSQKCIDIMAQTGKQYSITAAQAHGNIGAYYLMKSDFDAAEEHFNAAHKIYTSKENAAEERLLARSYENMGKLANAKGKYAEALDCFEKAAEIYERVFGENSVVTSINYQNLSAALSSLNRYDEALHYLDRCLEIQKRVCGENSALVSTTYTLMCNAYFLNDDSQNAVACGSKALELSVRLFGEQSVVSANLCTLLAGCYLQLDDYKKAREYCERGLPVLQKLLGENNMSVAACYNLLSVISDAEKDTKQSAEYQKKAVKIYKKTGVVAENAIISYYDTEGDSFFDNGMYFMATIFYKKLLKHEIKVYGEYSDDVSNCLTNIAICCYNRKKYLSAIKYYCRALRGKLSAKHPNDSEIEDILTSIGDAFYYYYERRVKSIKKVIKTAETYLSAFPQTLAYVLNDLYDHLDDGDRYETVIQEKVEKLRDNKQ